MQTLIKGAKVYTKSGLKDSDILIRDGKIERIAPNCEVPKHVEIIKADGLTAFPSFIDMHVHLREPGYSYKETIKTGSMAGAAGGFTTLCTMPNLNPAPDSLPHLKEQLDIISRDACIDILPFATITTERKGEVLADYEAMAPYVCGFSDDGTGVQSEEIMREAMKGISKTGKILSAHCEVESLLKGGYIHEGEYARKKGHKGICSKSEWQEVERDIQLAEETGCRLHICHISTKESVELVRQAKAKGLPVTCETGPHYLTFTDMDLQEHGRFKMNPPIRSIEDREALRAGLIDGTIDVVATDHAPHSAEEKSKGLQSSAMGVVGLETSFGAVYTVMVRSGLMSLDRLVEVMAGRARELLALPGTGFIEEGGPADITLVDLNESHDVDPTTFMTMGRSTPFEGMRLYGTIKMTLHNGNPVYSKI